MIIIIKNSKVVCNQEIMRQIKVIEDLIIKEIKILIKGREGGRRLERASQRIEELNEEKSNLVMQLK